MPGRWKTEQLVGPGTRARDRVSAPCRRLRSAGLCFWQKAARPPAAQGWALPEDPTPVESAGRRKMRLAAVSEEVVSGSQIGAGGRRPGQGPQGPLPKVPAWPPAPLQVPSVLMPVLEGDTWRQERSPAKVSPFFHAQVGGAAETLPSIEAAQSGGNARRRGQDTCQGLCTHLSKKMYVTSKHQSVPQVSPVLCKDPKAALRAGGWVLGRSCLFPGPGGQREQAGDRSWQACGRLTSTSRAAGACAAAPPGSSGAEILPE